MMSFEGFIRYMNSEECSIFKSQHRSIYQDMTQPLCDYFISSSHNTYLIADQVMGPSHLWGYTRYLDIVFQYFKRSLAFKKNEY